MTNLDLNQELEICINGGDPDARQDEDAFGREPSSKGNCEKVGSDDWPVCGWCERIICHWHIVCNITWFLDCILHLNINPLLVDVFNGMFGYPKNGDEDDEGS